MRAMLTALSAITPLDGRYREKLSDTFIYFSEYALIRYRVIVELQYYYFFCTRILHKKVSQNIITTLINAFDEKKAAKVKVIEKRINHDVKAVEYYVRDILTKKKLGAVAYVHFALTSEDVNALAYGLMLRDARKYVVVPHLKLLVETLSAMAKTYADVPMLARTHGQAAVPTTMGKELLNFAMRLHKALQDLKNLPIEGKLNGAVGNYNAHVVGFPHVDWVKESDAFITSLGLVPNHYTTQIIPADSQIQVFQRVKLINTILIGLSQDMWRYISDGYFIQEIKKHEVGSSTMPQKVNPINFENAEGNLGLANATLEFLSEKLPISRLQRDLSDSTVKRSIGTALATSVLGYLSLQKGLERVSVDVQKLEDDLLNHWEIVTEGIQTVLRTIGDTEAYEKVKAFARGKSIQEKDIHAFIETLSVSPSIKNRLKKITPLSYVGLSNILVQKGLQEMEKEEV